MNGSDSGFRDAGMLEQNRVTNGFRIVRSIVGLIFLLIAVGLTAAQRMRPEADTSVVNAPRPRHAVSEPDAPSRGTPSQQPNQATAIQSQAVESTSCRQRAEPAAFSNETHYPTRRPTC